MNVYSALSKETEESPRKLILVAVLGGIANGALLTALSSITTNGMAGPTIEVIVVIFSMMLLYYYTKRYTMIASYNMIENVINSIRKRIVGKMSNADLYSFEGLDKPKIYSALTHETGVLSTSVTMLVNAFQASIIVIFCLLYIGYISIPTFLVMLLGFLLGGYTYKKIRKEADETLELTMKKEAHVFSALEHMLEGFKEIKLNQQKDNEVFNVFKNVTADLKDLNVKAGVLFAKNMVYTQGYFYFLIGVVVFLLPAYVDIDSETVTTVTIATLFMIAPILMVLVAIPQLSRANIAVQSLYELEKKLDEIQVKTQNVQFTPKKAQDFKEIEFRNIVFSYTSDSSSDAAYSIGPINLTIKRGEILFIVGGNGSGKTTFLKLITGLYTPKSGTILLDGKIVDLNNIISYREFFTGIFDDYHLFDKLYGVKKSDEDKVNDLIEQMELSEKTSYVNGSFTNVSLSQGQRKRLGMIVSLMEDKPIMVFDEWAQDQAPYFKEYFYEELLQEIKASGKAVIVISHDDRYFDVADKVIVMEYGKIKEES